jgi:rhomboid protease GluP
VPFVTVVSIVVFGLSLLASGPNVGMRGSLLGFLSPDPCVLVQFGGSGAIPVFGLHRWWTFLSAGWLHGSLLHILFSVLWIRQLAPVVAELYGPGRMVIVYTIAAITGFAASSTAGILLPFMPPILSGARLTVGASAPIFGLLGALVYYGRRGGSSMVRAQAWSWAIPAFLFGFIMPGIDNYAHAGGFLGGWLAGRWLDPLRPERIDHMIAALGCLVAVVLTIIVSLLMPFTLLDCP